MFKNRFAKLKVKDIEIVDRRIQKIDTLNALVEDIKHTGLINPISVEEREDGKYILIAGFHRLQAHKALMKEEIECNIRKYDKKSTNREKDLSNQIAKHGENHVRQVFTPAEVARDFMELEKAYEERYPNYKEEPIAYIERYNEKIERKKRLELLSTQSKNKNDKEMFSSQIQEIKKDLIEIAPPTVTIMEKFGSNFTAKDIDTVKKLAETEKQVSGLINAIEEEKVPKTTLNKIIGVLSEPTKASDFVNADKFGKRKEMIEEMKITAKIQEDKKPMRKLHEDIFEIGKQKNHGVAMAEQRHLIPNNKYNTTIEVKNKKLVQSALKVFDIEHLKVLIVMYDRKTFDNFISNFNEEI